MSAERCPVCGSVPYTTSNHGYECYPCGISRHAKMPETMGKCKHAERLAIERAAEILVLENNCKVSGEQEAAARDELRRLKNAEHITAEIELAAGQPALIVSAYDMPIGWKPGDIVRITLESQGGK